MTKLKIQEIQTTEAIDHLLPAIIQLRPHLDPKHIASQLKVQFEEGYRILSCGHPDLGYGFIGFRIQTMLYTGKTLYIDDLSTETRARGQGIASRLLEEVEVIAQGSGVQNISLDSGPSRHDAHRLYLNSGFQLSSHHFNKSLNS